MNASDLGQDIKSAINGKTDEMYDVKFSVTGNMNSLVVVAKSKNPKIKPKYFSVFVKEM